MTKSRDLLRTALNHQQSDRIPVDFGSNAVTGIHVLVVDKLREYFGLEKHSVKVIEPYQMLGEIENDLLEAMGIDVIGLWAKNNMFGIAQENFRPFKTFWGQEVLVPENFNTKINDNGDLLIFPEVDTSAPASGKMPKAGYFFDAIVRQSPIDESTLKAEDNLEEFSAVTDKDLAWWK